MGVCTLFGTKKHKSTPKDWTKKQKRLDYGYIIYFIAPPMTTEIKDLLEEATQARIGYAVGQITREEAKERIMPYLNAANEKAKEIAKKYNKKASPISFISFIR